MEPLYEARPSDLSISAQWIDAHCPVFCMIAQGVGARWDVRELKFFSRTEADMHFLHWRVAVANPIETRRNGQLRF